jgi:hypothetical protein
MFLIYEVNFVKIDLVYVTYDIENAIFIFHLKKNVVTFLIEKVIFVLKFVSTALI